MSSYCGGSGGSNLLAPITINSSRPGCPALQLSSHCNVSSNSPFGPRMVNVGEFLAPRTRVFRATDRGAQDVCIPRALSAAVKGLKGLRTGVTAIPNFSESSPIEIPRLLGDAGRDPVISSFVVIIRKKKPFNRPQPAVPCPAGEAYAAFVARVTINRRPSESESEPILRPKWHLDLEPSSLVNHLKMASQPSGYLRERQAVPTSVLLDEAVVYPGRRTTDGVA